MTLPSVKPYAMPTAAELPAGKLHWPLEADRAALLVHDMQNHFLRAYDRRSEPVPTLLAHVRDLIDHAHRAGIPVIYTAQPGGQTDAQRGLLKDLWGAGISPEPEDAKIVDDLTPLAQDIRLTKWRYSAFHSTALAAELAAQDRDQLIICGIYAHIGCMVTATEAFMSGIQPFLVADAVADFSREYHDMALRWVAERSGVVVTTSDVASKVAGRVDAL